MHQSYAQWVRTALAISRRGDGGVISLFDSSVPEPRELLRQAISDTVTPKFSTDYVSTFDGGNRFVVERLAKIYAASADQILCTTGTSAGLSLAMKAFARPGDHILIEMPGFDLFTMLANDAGLNVDYFQRSGPHYSIDVDRLASAFTSRTRLVVLTNLHNPSGMALDYHVLSQIAAVAESRGAYVLVDEVYGDYASREVRPFVAAHLSPALISISSLTKSFGLASVRCGWVIASRKIIQMIQSVSDRIEFGVSNISHAVAANILVDPSRFEKYSREEIARTRPILESWYANVSAEGLVSGQLPEYGCICFPFLPRISDTGAFSNWLVEQHGVIVAPGEYFGRAGHIRIGFVQPEGNLEKGLEALRDGLIRYENHSAGVTG